MESILSKYARLLVDYCLDIKEGDQLYISSTSLGEPLVREVFRRAIMAGAHVDTHLEFRERYRIFIENASEDQLKRSSPLLEHVMQHYDAYLNIRAPHNLREDQSIDSGKSKMRRKAQGKISRIYFKRTGEGQLKRSLCQFPTQASAQEAGMSLEEYQQFVYRACKLYEPNPVESWLQVRSYQQKIVDFLNKRESIRFRTADTDISFSTKGRKWINSDGRSNMPSGEVFTSPVEDSVNGIIHFSFPAIYLGHEVEGVKLWVKDGFIERWEARRGKKFLDQIFSMDGTRRFGEAAIGTNDSIDQLTKNILFDEKMGGSIHMAIGQSYLQAGGKNESSIHWDMISDMKKEGEIFADDEKIYEKGRFLFLD
ncbi:MAG: aminopeptidase [Saprospiraceae bacterium]|nr:aminopeptidase [Saprospiraceae bacterium]